ncbi:MAG: enoyl-CoA hydratase/isomerase family protein [Acidobacteria bacterium]|nr:enoyl-CoA hydratase/isomerase family protein [Acidobacteriota bacterium]MCB9397332.1 enoyl-CoA hydratase/isomerase family protein [Acidobacteriota bacterium]
MVRFDSKLQALVLQQGQRKNRLSLEALHELGEWFDRLAKLDLDRLLLISEDASIFCAGADINDLVGLNQQSARDYSLLGQGLMARIESFTCPVWAFIEGPCFGGGVDLVLACHHRVAGPSASFCHPGVQRGIVTGFGGTVLLPEIIGLDRALTFFVTGQVADAQTALQWGLVQAIQTREDFLAAWQK